MAHDHSTTPGWACSGVNSAHFRSPPLESQHHLPQLASGLGGLIGRPRPVGLGPDVDHAGPFQVPQAFGEQPAGQAWGAVGDLVEGPAADEDVAQDDHRPALGKDLRRPSDRAELSVASHTDIDDNMLAAAQRLVNDENLDNVTLSRDDLFASNLERGSFDLVHARFELTPLGHVSEQVAIYLRLAEPGGLVVVEDPDIASWHFNPPAPAAEQLIALLAEAFRRWGDPDAVRKQLELFREAGIEANVRAEVLALPPGHPYLRLPLQMVTGLKTRLESFVDANGLEQLIAQAEDELKETARWGTTFTLLQSWGRKPT